MTTINASVFSGLTGANPALVSRAVALINDARLTSLEPLRQDLNNEAWTIRVATVADDMRGNPALFVDPVRDDQNNILQQGQIVLRAEDLVSSSDPSVLRLIDNLNHEGRGHGTTSHVADRAIAARALTDTTSGLSATERGDRYINAILDDETTARYESYQFRTQLASLNTEYAASNRASLATDPLYQEFAQLEGVADGLGLTGSSKSAYVIQNSRDQMAAYNNHSYPLEASQYVIQVLQLNGTQQGASYLNHVRQTYNETGYDVTDVVTQDDGSSSASILYEDGARTDLVFDTSGTLYQRTDTTAGNDQTTTRYAPNGSVAQITETDGAQNNADYNSRVTTYDADGRTDSVSLYRDDGSRDRIDYDQANASTANRWEQHFDAQGREDWLNTVMDDGSRNWVDYDQANVDAAARWEYRFDSQGRQDWYQGTLDDGSRHWVDYDQTNADAAARWEQWFDPQGRQDWYQATLDDGSRYWVDYDQTNADAAARWEQWFDSYGREDWYQAILDDGSRNWVDYDQTGTQGWSSVQSHFDAWGREDYATMFLDDGSRNTFDYDQDGSQRWSRMESHFGANGRAEYSTTFNDDGSRLVIDHDYNGHLGEHAIITYSAAGRAHLVGWTRDGYDGLIFTPAGGVIGADGNASGPPSSFGQFPAALPYLPAIYSDTDGDGPSWTIETPWGDFHGT
ncbi:MAG: hypothetical protein WA159_24675 [Variovorax sp.]